ncbi:MAG: hypothetical protein GY854_18150 [Deltaproteobacteria bacterium]|nr:hypothetical protein [Deltaproteobacteria bacterium]
MPERRAVKTVLWFDNDPAMIEPYSAALRDEGYTVTIARSITEANSALESETFDLLILDVMIPTFDDAEEEEFSPEETDCGGETGLAFYRRRRQMLSSANTEVLVITVRLDKAIRDAFIAEGLATERIATKIALRTVDLFLERVREILGD